MSNIQQSDTKNRPFVSAPDPGRYFPATTFEEARLRISRSILRGEGPTLLIGAPGTGKTMLVEVLAEQFKNSMTIVPLAGAQLCTRRALLQMILFQVGLPYQGMDEGELRLSLLNFLNPLEGPKTRLLLLVDEAESLPNRLLEELRVLTNIAKSGQPLVNLVLAGNTSLEERFAEPQLEVFSQRISSRSYLAPMNRAETSQYIKAQIAASESNSGTLFSEDALEAIFATTDGVPRLVNQLGDQLIWMANETDFTTLDSDLVQQAWSELQQLPAPWNSPKEISNSAVEFGELDMPSSEQEFRTVEDELPASIPFTSENNKSLDSSINEKLDATEDLLMQLNELSPSIQTKNESQDPATKNPFNEIFDTEESVVDRYSSFESHLLTSAIVVENKEDICFSEQIQHYEIRPTQEVKIDSSTMSTFEVEENLDVSASELNMPVGDESTQTSVYDTSELLVIEENEDEVVEVVPGKRFRQLFSGLHEQNDQRSFG